MPDISLCEKEEQKIRRLKPRRPRGSNGMIEVQKNARDGTIQVKRESHSVPKLSGVCLAREIENIQYFINSILAVHGKAESEEWFAVLK